MTATAAAASTRPVTVKLRAGIDDLSMLTENLHAVTSAGAALVTPHGRLRIEPYFSSTDWRRLQVAADWMQQHAPEVPFVGNGSVDSLAAARSLLATLATDS